MLSPGFIDMMMFFILVAFTLKGGLTGFIRSVVTILAVAGAWILSGMFPELTGFIVQYSVPKASPYYPIIVRVFTFVFLWIGIQCLGFLATGLIEKIGLGTADKFVGLVLGVFTGVAVSCLPIAIIFSVPALYHSAPIQRYFQKSFFMKTYHPVVKNFIRVPRKPSQG